MRDWSFASWHTGDRARTVGVQSWLVRQARRAPRFCFSRASYCMEDRQIRLLTRDEPVDFEKMPGVVRARRPKPVFCRSFLAGEQARSLQPSTPSTHSSARSSYARWVCSVLGLLLFCLSHSRAASLDPMSTYLTSAPAGKRSLYSTVMIATRDKRIFHRLPWYAAVKVDAPVFLHRRG